MEEQAEAVIKKGKKEKNGGKVSLIIFGIITVLFGIISIFETSAFILVFVLILCDLCFGAMMFDGNNRINNPEKYIVNTQGNMQSGIIKAHKNEKNHFEAYKSKWLWEAAAKEYLQLKGKECLDELTEDDNDKIYEYASMPAIYFFAWLIENKFMSTYFYLDSDKEITGDVLDRKKTPVKEFVYGLDCSLTRDDMSEEILMFADQYFEGINDRNYINFSALDKSDYYECIKNEQNFIFCIDFSWGIYDKISEKIDSAFKSYQEKQ